MMGLALIFLSIREGQTGDAQGWGRVGGRSRQGRVTEGLVVK